jgi:hypothetical protein
MVAGELMEVVRFDFSILCASKENKESFEISITFVTPMGPGTANYLRSHQWLLSVKGIFRLQGLGQAS